MRVDADELVWEMRKGADLYFWVPGRVRDCPHRACRRARKCMRPEILPHRRLLGLPSCRMVKDREWEAWSEAFVRYAFGPSKDAAKDIAAIAEKHLKAARQERQAQR